jgi:hypothetical protein
MKELNENPADPNRAFKEAFVQAAIERGCQFCEKDVIVERIQGKVTVSINLPDHRFSFQFGKKLEIFLRIKERVEVHLPEIYECLSQHQQDSTDLKAVLEILVEDYGNYAELLQV